MSRTDRDGDELRHLPLCRKLYDSKKISPEDKKIVDDLFIKNYLRLSEEEKLYELYRKIKSIDPEVD